MTKVHTVTLGDVAKESVRRLGKSVTDGPVYGVDKEVGLTGEPRYQSKDLTRYKLIAPGMFAYNPMRLNIGSIGYCHRNLEPGVVSPDYVVFDCDNSELLSEFMYYHTKSPLWMRWLNLAGEGSVRERIYFRKLAEYELKLPALTYQKAAVSILSALDDKIELNRRLNETLEGIAQVIFKDWFVDFGPVRRKQDGATDPITILGGLTQDLTRATELAALFPASFGDGGVPEGWRNRPVIDLANWVNGAAYKNMHFVDIIEGLPVIKIAELKSGITSQTKFTNTYLGERYRIDNGELLFSWSGNPETSIDTFIWTGGAAWLNQHIFAVRSDDEAQLPYLYVLLKWFRPTFSEIARNKQTTGLGHVTKDDLKRLNVATASDQLHAGFLNFVSPLFGRLKNTLFETRTLTETRDYLLPKLISGDLHVHDAEKMAG